MSNEISKIAVGLVKSPARLVMFILMCVVTVGFVGFVVKLGNNQFFAASSSKAECYDWGCNIEESGYSGGFSGYGLGGGAGMFEIDDPYGSGSWSDTGGGGSESEADKIRRELEEKQRKCDEENGKLQQLIDGESAELLHLRELLEAANVTKSEAEEIINGDGSESEKNIAKINLSLVKIVISQLEQQIKDLPLERRHADPAAVQDQMRKINEMGCVLAYIAR